MNVKVKVKQIDYCIQRPDALLIYMVDGKVWVCDKNQELPKNENELFITLKLKSEQKDKCDK